MTAARGDPARAAIVLDFDGTLAPIVDDPARAEPHPEVVKVLAGLSGQWGRVAVVSGRPVAYLLGRLGGRAGAELYGLYGMERALPNTSAVQVAPEAEEWRQVVSDAASEAVARAPAGVEVEPKGLAVTLHFRSAPRLQTETETLAAQLSRETGLLADSGKMSVELRPPVEHDKGTVLRSLASGCVAVLFAGDDRGDLPAFAELARLREKGLATLGVAAGGPETPAEVEEAADLVVDGPQGVVELLSRLRL